MCSPTTRFYSILHTGALITLVLWDSVGLHKTAQETAREYLMIKIRVHVVVGTSKLISQALLLHPLPPGVCGWIPRVWMRRVKITCLSTCCWSAVQRQRCVPSSSSPSSTPRERRPKPWVSQGSQSQRFTATEQDDVWKSYLYLDLAFVTSVRREPEGLSLCSR